ncbi:hypothetical protein WJX73_001985 [Symbiochloris irregularis]|uniref:glycine--tRNA ligase n=1 Tax=Symbiochloris irregularis TaxID=706552 RepID=A0AAW1NUE7_9CHLO
MSEVGCVMGVTIREGREISQFTYFQQAGGMTLPVPAVEITYGLERILMALQKVQHFKDIRFNASLTYGEMFMEREYQNSVYNLEEADVAAQRSLFEIYRDEARRLVDRKLPVPAYDHLLKMSATFNLLDARGAVSVTERADCFAAMRGIARNIAKMWTAKREELEWPLGEASPPAPLPPSDDEWKAPGTHEDFVLEVGCEELPPTDLDAAIRQLSEAVPGLLKELQLDHGGVTVEGTPRRLVAMVSRLATQQQQVRERLRGPPLKVAFSAEGTPTKALQGFCKKNSIPEDEVVREGDYVWAEVAKGGRSSKDVLAEALPGLLASLGFPKSMRWAGSTAFSRPVRWLVAVQGPNVIPFQFAGLWSGRTTRGLRTASMPLFQVNNASEYAGALGREGITLSVQQRKQAIWAAVGDVARYFGGYIQDTYRGDLLQEVIHLVESPTIVGGSFSPDFLQIPGEILTSVMLKHQRYFPVSDAVGHLLACFVTVANGPIDPPSVTAGNEAVLRARFQDAKFFYEEDLKRSLADFRPQLAGILFHKDLGTLLDKTERVVALVKSLARVTGMSHADAEVAAQAADLARADLATSVVVELTSLAGTMGRHYALKSGLSEGVAQAIFESVLPRTAGDALPQSAPGALLAAADQLDSLVGFFAAGCAPSAAADPYSLRRKAYALLQILVARDMRLDLRVGIAEAAQRQPLDVPDKTQEELYTFIQRRLEQLLVDGGVRIEAARAVLAERGHDPALAAASARELAAELKKGDLLQEVLTTMSRPIRLVRSQKSAADSSQPDSASSVNISKFELPEERALWEAYLQLQPKIHARMPVKEFLAACSDLSDPTSAYFDKVFVMCDDEAVRTNRLTMLTQLAKLPRGIMDFAELPGF